MKSEFYLLDKEIKKKKEKNKISGILVTLWLKWRNSEFKIPFNDINGSSI